MKRLWSVAGKFIGGLLVASGGALSLGLLVTMQVSQAQGGLLALLAVLLVFFGLGPSSLGGWLLYSGWRMERQVWRDRFFQLLQAQQGKVSLVEFAAATQLEPATARRLLDSWAKEFAATFEVSEGGDIYYVFSTQAVSLPSSDWLPKLGQWVRRLESIV
jgi:hypothetical protein